jgi:tight adherence protein C
MLGLASLACLALALRPTRRGAHEVPLVFRLAGRVPVPAGIVAAVGGPDRQDVAAAAGLAPALGPGSLPRARCAMAFAALAMAPLALAAPPLLPAVLVAAPLGWLLPGVVLGRRASARRRRIAAQLPDVLELLGVCIAAGMSLDPALRVVAARLDGPLTDEIGLALADMALGASRRDAYRSMARRVGLPDLDQAVAALVTAEELGTPLSAALGLQAANLRAAAAQAARDGAARAAPKVQLIVATMMVPAVMLLVVTVMAVELGRQMGPVLGGIR